MVFTVLSFLCSFIVQYQIDSSSPGSISVFTQVPQIVLMVIAELLISVTGLEFAFTCAPKELKSTISSLFYLTSAIGNLITVILVSAFASTLSSQALILVFSLLMSINLGVYVLLMRGIKLTPQIQAAKGEDKSAGGGTNAVNYSNQPNGKEVELHERSDSSATV
jgi:dipeptide/tripeptide permease